MSKYELLKERALANFETLLIKWGIHYAKIGGHEYDFLSPTRSNDANLGACRFNASKGIGADFAGSNISTGQIREILGVGFNNDDFAGFTKYGETRNSFDVIGLAQRIYNLDGYKEAATKLREDLDSLGDCSSQSKIQLLERSIKRDLEVQNRRSKSLAHAAKAWSYCSDINGTIGANYLKSRNIIGPYSEPNMKFHKRIYNTELKCFIPALVFKISKTHDGQLAGIHRIWVAADGSRKAHLSEPKKAIGQIQGNGIWFGEPDKVLAVCEGPENALDLRYHKKLKFVVSTISCTNYHTLTIPEYVELVVIVPDPDPAGYSAAVKAQQEYKNQGKEARIIKI